MLGFRFGSGNLLIAHGTIYRAEVHDAVADLSDAIARPYRVVVDLCLRVNVVKFAEPFGIDRIWEDRSNSIDALRADVRDRQVSRKCYVLHSSPKLLAKP